MSDSKEVAVGAPPALIPVLANDAAEVRTERHSDQPDPRPRTETATIPSPRHGLDVRRPTDLDAIRAQAAAMLRANKAPIAKREIGGYGDRAHRLSLDSLNTTTATAATAVAVSAQEEAAGDAGNQSLSTGDRSIDEDAVAPSTAGDNQAAAPRVAETDRPSALRSQYEANRASIGSPVGSRRRSPLPLRSDSRSSSAAGGSSGSSELAALSPPASPLPHTDRGAFLREYVRLPYLFVYLLFFLKWKGFGGWVWVVRLRDDDLGAF